MTEPPPQSKWSQRKDAKRMMYLMSTEKAATGFFFLFLFLFSFSFSFSFSFLFLFLFLFHCLWLCYSYSFILSFLFSFYQFINKEGALLEGGWMLVELLVKNVMKLVILLTNVGTKVS